MVSSPFYCAFSSSCYCDGMQVKKADFKWCTDLGNDGKELPTNNIPWHSSSWRKKMDCKALWLNDFSCVICVTQHAVLCSPLGPVQQDHVPDSLLRWRCSQRVLAGQGRRHQPRLPGLRPGPEHQWEDNWHETLAIRESSQWCWCRWVQWCGAFNQWLAKGYFLSCWDKLSGGPGLMGGRRSLCFWPGFPLFLCTLLLLGQ